MIMQRVIFRSLPIFPVLNLGHFILTTLDWVSCFVVFPRSRWKRHSQCVSFASWSQHVSLSDFRGNSRFIIFKVTRAVLETLPSHMHLAALWSQRAAVKSRHTQQRVVLWLRRLYELANPWKRFKSLVMFLNPCLAKFWSQLVPLLFCLVFRLCERLCLVLPPLREAVVPSFCERRCWSGFREKHCCTNREV